jgi:ABC-type antimicrobial peptide transport system permease subunit
MENDKQENGILTSDGTPGLVAETLAKEFPEVKYAAQVAPEKWFAEAGNFNLAYDSKNINASGQFVGKDFFNVFSYHLIQGNPNQVLTDNNSIVISESLAKRIFHTTENVVGKTLEWQLLRFKQTAIISGIFNDVPSNSSRQFDFVLSFEIFKKINPGVLSWGNNGTNAFLVLKEGVNANLFNKKIADLIKQKNGSNFRTLFIRHYSDGYLYGKYENGVQVGGRIEYVRLFSIIAIFILLIACINFMNLSTARATLKMKEIGIKKTIGASRKSLIFQHIGESVFMVFISLLIAFAIVEFILPEFNALTGKHLSLNLKLYEIFFILGLTLLTGLLAGSYPAFYLSSFNPVVVLKSKMKDSIGELWVRKGLVVFQFALSVILIVSVLVVYKQIEFIQNKNLGYNKENVIQFPNEGKVAENTDTFISEMKELPGIINAATIQQNIMGTQSATTGLNWKGKNPKSIVQFIDLAAGYNFIETLGLKMKEGRAFSKDFGDDKDKLIFNETAIKTMDIKNPIGKTVNLWGKNMQIIGVVKDFNIESLHERIKPLFIKLPSGFNMTIIARIKAGMTKQTVDDLQKLYKQFNPGYTFNFKFLDQDYQSLYIADQRVSALSKYFAGLAIIISCLGLFGLASYTAERKTKEIGIRKVLGASVSGVVGLLSGEFIKLVLLANFIAWPIAWYLTNKWLQDFAYKINIGYSIFILAGVVSILITLLTVSFHAIKAATANPVKSLRYE